MNFNLLIDAGVIIAETPIWDGRIQKLYWTDLFAGSVHRFDPKTKTDETCETGMQIGSAIPCDEPGFLLCALENGMYLLDFEQGELEFLFNPEKREGYKFNDTRVDAAGRIFTSSVSKYCGTEKHTPDMLGKFYMIETDGAVSALAENIEQYNGIVWNSDNSKMFVVDTAGQKLLCFPYALEQGPVGIRYTAIDFKAIGMPDGISIDEDDNLYVCHWSGKISVWDKNCALKQIIDFPVEYVCCGGFGGIDMKDFFVATSKFNYSAAQLEQNKGAGGIFTARSDVRGRSDYFFRIRK